MNIYKNLMSSLILLLASLLFSNVAWSDDSYGQEKLSDSEFKEVLKGMSEEDLHYIVNELTEYPDEANLDEIVGEIMDEMP